MYQRERMDENSNCGEEFYVTKFNVIF